MAEKECLTETSLPSSQDAKRREKMGTVTWDEIASKLLQDRLLLTALELHAELSEAGSELPRLRDFFSNPANFESLGKTVTDVKFTQDICKCLYFTNTNWIL